MKKLITLTFALLFSAGIAFGQNSATTSQSGNNNQAKIAQHNSGNEATINQDGNNNTVQKMDQTYLANNGASGINVADISQVGSNNTVKNNGNYSGAIQSGASNSFSVDQAGKGNVVENIHQGTSSNISTNGIMDIVQGKNAGGDYRWPNYNIVYHASQFGNGNELHVKQNEEDHVYVQAQISTGETGNFISIYQNGYESNVGHKDNGHGSGGYGIYQNGTNNSMNIQQDTHSHAGTKTVSAVFGSADNGGHGGQSLIQLGSDNSFTAVQAGNGSTIEALLQNGVGNNASITQGMGAQTAGVSQVGNGNTSIITQN
jgi:hypothetical protein